MNPRCIVSLYIIPWFIVRENSITYLTVKMRRHAGTQLRDVNFSLDCQIQSLVSFMHPASQVCVASVLLAVQN
jgi:hypothetical protein